MKKKTFTLIMGLLLTALGAAAQNSGTTGPLTWNYNAGTKTLSVTGTGAMPDYENKDAQPWKAFQNDMEKITIGNGVTAIGRYAFHKCEKVKSITLPATLTEIKFHGFSFCKALQSITLPAALTKIGDYAFTRCSKLQSVTLPATLTEIKSNGFSYCTALESITLPAGLKKLEHQAFESCTALKNIVLPEGITEIAYYTFFGCRALESITIPGTVTTIEHNAFTDCSALKSIRIPSAVGSIGEYAFSGCKALQEVIVGWDTPLAIDADVFTNVTLSGVTLKVPKGTKAKYQAAPVWKDFKINETTANQTVDGLRVFAAAGALYLTLPKAETVHIYNVDGAMVKTLTLSAGDHVQPLPSGVYLVRVGEQVRKIFVK